MVVRVLCRQDVNGELRVYGDTRAVDANLLNAVQTGEQRSDYVLWFQEVEVCPPVVAPTQPLSDMDKVVKRYEEGGFGEGQRPRPLRKDLECEVRTGVEQSPSPWCPVCFIVRARGGIVQPVV